MIKVGQVTASTTENSLNLDMPNNSILIIIADTDVLISINDNKNYQLYKSNEVILLNDKYDPLTKIYYKTSIGTSTFRYWAY